MMKTIDGGIPPVWADGVAWSFEGERVVLSFAASGGASIDPADGLDTRVRVISARVVMDAAILRHNCQTLVSIFARRERAAKGRRKPAI